MRVQAKEARITLLVGGMPLQVVPVRDLAVTETPIAQRNISGAGWEITLECVGDMDFDGLWYDVVHHPDALDRWADDGGAVPS